MADGRVRGVAAFLAEYAGDAELPLTGKARRLPTSTEAPAQQ